MEGLPYDQRKRVAQNVYDVWLSQDHRQCPQAASKSLSPYIMANSFNFDVSMIVDDIKEIKRKKEIQEEYAEIRTKDLELLLSDVCKFPRVRCQRRLR